MVESLYQRLLEYGMLMEYKWDINGININIYIYLYNYAYPLKTNVT
jgi:hypothetical protein